MIYYCTDDLGRWGPGLGVLLDDWMVDRNFYNVDSRITTLEETVGGGALRSIDYIVGSGSTLVIHYTDHTESDPITMPVARWAPKGAWKPSTSYAELDVFFYGMSIYEVLLPHVSDTAFDAGATDGLGNDLYGLLITIPAIPVITVTGTTFSPTLSQINSYFRFTNVAGCTITLPPNASFACDVGTELHFLDDTGGGHIVIEATAPATIKPVGNYLFMSAVDGATVGVKKLDTDLWSIFGLLMAGSP